jgi:hypothetical protein
MWMMKQKAAHGIGVERPASATGENQEGHNHE